MNKAIKYRIYPNEAQEEVFQKTFGCCRKIWNLMLEDKINYYKETKKSLQTTPAKYKKEYEYLKEVDSLALANVQLKLQIAYKNFFRDKKIGTIQILDNKIKLPKIGKIRAEIHRKAEEFWIIKLSTISQEKDGTYYVSVLYEYEKEIN